MSKQQKEIPPEYLFWRKRIEGQIRHTIREHPEWFNLSNEEIRDRCIRSTAKRIIGEIVAGTPTGNSVNGGGTVTAAISPDGAVQDCSATPEDAGGIKAAGILLDNSSREPVHNKRSSE